MILKLPRWAKRERPRAADLNKLPEQIERLLNLTVNGTSGLQVEWRPDGWTLSYIPRQLVQHAIITTQVPAASGSTDGKGAGTLETDSYNSSGVHTRALTSPAKSVVIYSGGKDVIAVGRRVAIYEKTPGRWHTLVDYCT